MKYFSKIVLHSICCFLFSCAVFFSLFTTADASVQSGKCGDNLIWEYDSETQVLTVSGTGDMYEYDDAGAAAKTLWSDLNGTVREVHILDGVTSIQGGAFEYWHELESVSIADSVMDIGAFTFRYCGNLKSVNIPYGITRIGYGTFDGCSSLTDIQLPETITKIGETAFRGCSKATINIPDSVIEIGYDAFYGCDNIKCVTIPRGMTSIDWYSFAKCSSLSQVYILGNITEICEHAFGGCSSLTDVYYWGTEEMWREIEIGYNNDFLRNATIHFNYTPPVENPFDDVNEVAYYAQPVLWAVENGITNGTSINKFSPESTCTRGQIVTFLWRAAGSPEPKSMDNIFTDVNPKEYYYKAVLWAVENGITNGMGKDCFAPNEPCTRGQVVTFLWRAKGKPVPTTKENKFNDVNLKEYYGDAVLWAVENGITNGMGKGRFAPNDICTRCQIVTFLYRAMA